MGEAVIAAGIGCRAGASREAVIAAINAALAAYRLDRSDLSSLATVRTKAREPGLVQAAAALSLPLAPLADAVLLARDAETPTRSARSLAATGVASVSEAAALAAAGDGSRLLGPRIVHGAVTCALAEGVGP